MSQPGYLRQLWHKYKSLRLPWRRQFLVGADLTGNTFWEFKDAMNANRFRRMVKYKGGSAVNYADVKISRTPFPMPEVYSNALTDGFLAQWHQWLRHTRPAPPSIQEQQYEVSRQAMMKQLAAQADERWRSIPSYLDAPKNQQAGPAMEVADSKPPDAGQSEVHSAVEGQEEAREKKAKEEKENPWARADRGAPSENWQPGAWSPGVAQRRG